MTTRKALKGNNVMIRRVKSIRQFTVVILVSALGLMARGDTRHSVAVTDAMRGPALRDVRLEGWLGSKMDRFISRRLVDPFMREQVFDEARQAFEFRDDDVARVGGLWRVTVNGAELPRRTWAEYEPEAERLRVHVQTGFLMSFR